MYCRNCGAKIADDSRFCSECGAVTASEPVRKDPAAQDPIQMNRRPAAGGSVSMPSGGAYPGGNGYSSAGGAYPGGNNPAAVPDYDSRTVFLDVNPAVFQGDWEANQSSAQRRNTGAPPYSVPPAGASQYPDPYGRQTPPGGGSRKNKRSPLVLVLIILGVLLVVVAALIIVFTASDKDDTDQTATSGTDTVAEVGAATADQTITQQGQAAGVNASQDTVLTGAQEQEVKEKIVGFWNSDDNKRFIGVMRLDNGLYYFTSGYWYSEADLVGYLQQPMTGDPDGTVSVHLYFEGYESEDMDYSFPPVDDDMQFDLSGTDNGVIGWNFYGDWVTFRYGGETMEDAMPSAE